MAVKYTLKIMVIDDDSEILKYFKALDVKEILLSTFLPLKMS